jgi:hypothetical protein
VTRHSQTTQCQGAAGVVKNGAVESQYHGPTYTGDAAACQTIALSRYCRLVCPELTKRVGTYLQCVSEGGGGGLAGWLRGGGAGRLEHLDYIPKYQHRIRTESALQSKFNEQHKAYANERYVCAHPAVVWLRGEGGAVGNC